MGHSKNVKVVPATTNVPCLGAPVVLLAANMVALPLPVPEVPLLTVIQLVLLTPVQAHPLGALTAIVAVTPPGAMVSGPPCTM
jgi:hypothetical protein